MFKSRNGTYKDIIILMVIAPILYFMAPIIFLRDKWDMQRGWSITQYQPRHDSPFNYDEIPNENAENFTGYLTNFSIDYMLAVEEKSSCTRYSMWQIFAYNYTFVIFYFFSLNYSHLSKIPIKHLSLTPDNLRKWGWKQYLLAVTALTFIFANAITGFIMYYKGGILFYYLSLLFGCFLFVLFVTLMLKKTHYFHLHHYAWGGLMFIMWGYQHIYITILAGLSSGIMIEGISRWGFDKWWISKSH